MEIGTNWVQEKIDKVQQMNQEIESRIDQLQKQFLMNQGALAILNELNNTVKSSDEQSVDDGFAEEELKKTTKKSD